MKVDQEVDVFLTLRYIYETRPQFVPTLVSVLAFQSSLWPGPITIHFDIFLFAIFFNSIVTLTLCIWQDQYWFLHELAQLCISRYDTYANFQ